MPAPPDWSVTVVNITKNADYLPNCADRHIVQYLGALVSRGKSDRLLHRAPRIGDSMKTLYLLLKAAPRHDRQIMRLAVAGSTLIVLMMLAAELMTFVSHWT
jgi:ABC-type dipeptide/oligopeptide/nickel transport system ATPase component